MSDKRDWLRLYDVEDPGVAAQQTARAFAAYTEELPLRMEPPPELRDRRVLHLIVLGNHLDPELGRWYVPPKPVLNRRERSLRHHRGLKVQRLLRGASESLYRGVDPALVQRDLRAQQAHQAVVMTTNEAELLTTLRRVFQAGDLLPGCIDGGYADLTPLDDWCFEWHEAISCEGGVTDRYSDISLQHEHDQHRRSP